MDITSWDERMYMRPLIPFQILDTLMIGLDGAGKTSILNGLQRRKFPILPTRRAANVGVVDYGRVTLTVWDFTGQGERRFLWRNYFEDPVGVIFVVDSSDVERMGQAKEDLWRILRQLNDIGLEKIPLLVYANKLDLQDSIPVVEVRDALDLQAIKGREWHIQGATALKGFGVKKGLAWYATQVKENMKGKTPLTQDKLPPLKCYPPTPK